MSMQWVTLRQQQETDGTVTVDRHWYLTESKTRVVEEGDPEGRWLWASPGTAVPLREAIRLGAVQVEQEPAVDDELREHPGKGEPMDGVEAPADGTMHELTSETGPPAQDVVEEKAEEKKAPPAANKAAKKATNKAAGPTEGK